MNVPPGSPQSFRSARLPAPGRGHRRSGSTSSQASVQSSASAPPGPAPTIPLPAPPPAANQGTSTYPAPVNMPLSPGRKMAEDMAYAVAMAQARMVQLTSPRSTAPSLPQSPTPSDMSSIGAAMLGQPQEAPEDPFELELDALTEQYLNLPPDSPTPAPTPRGSFGSSTGSTSTSSSGLGQSPRATWPEAPDYPPGLGFTPAPNNTQDLPGDLLQLYPMPPGHGPRHPDLRFGPTTSGGMAQPAGGQPHAWGALKPRHNPFSGTPMDQNAVAVTWRGGYTQTFALISKPTPTEQMTEEERFFPMKVQGSTTQVVQVPRGWAGRVQKLTGEEYDPATWCELTFDGFKGMTFFNVSYVHGNNGPVVMYPWRSQQRSGSPFKALQVAPDAIVGQDARRHRVVYGTDAGVRQRREAVRRFYLDFEFTPAQGALLPDDDMATLATHDRHIVCEFLN